MRNKIAATIVALIALAGTALVAAPANAAYYEWAPLNCVKDDASVHNASGSLAVNKNANGYYKVTITFNDTINRSWAWKMFHDGDVSFFNPAVEGDFTAVREMLDFPGTDYIKATVQNAGNTMFCSATIAAP